MNIVQQVSRSCCRGETTKIKQIKEHFSKCLEKKKKQIDGS